MAKAFYNSLTESQDADSAGLHVHEPGQTLQERKAVSESKHFFVLDTMKQAGIDISNYTRTPLSKDMQEKYDLVVSMAKKEESPDWLLNSPNYTYWEINDPRGQDLATTTKVRDAIKSKVSDLINQK